MEKDNSITLPIWAAILIGVIIIAVIISGAIEIFSCLCGNPENLFHWSGDSKWLEKF